jgi:Zn-dependent protease
LPREETPSVIVQKDKSYEYVFTFPPLKPAKSHVHFSIKEIEHLSVAAVLIIGVGLSILWFQGFSFSDYLALSLFVAMFTVSFLAHEIAHKVVAQRHGLWAEFRLIVIGALLTMLSIISPLFKIIAPGAVMVAGSSDRRTIGKTSIAGPATNITLATAFLAGTFLFTQSNPTLAPVAFFNAWIALFNLIPLGILDGFKIFSWDKKIWTMAFAASIALAVLSYQRLPSY